MPARPSALVRNSRSPLRDGVLLGAMAAWAWSGAASAQTLLGPSPYLSFSGQSPFAGLGFQSFYLENFEDGLFNTPGATSSPSWAVPPPQVLDSVDEDDGAVNGTGATAKSFYSFGQSFITVTFSASVLGQLPTHAGIVWTDVGITTNGQAYGFGSVIFEAFGPGGVSLGTIGPTAVGDGVATGETGEDRFFGVISLGGIESFTLTATNSTDWEVDHIQYGIIPAPGMLALAGIAGCAAVRRRR